MSAHGTSGASATGWWNPKRWSSVGEDQGCTLSGPRVGVRVVAHRWRPAVSASSSSESSAPMER
ncbi:MAG: hypothetical protein R2755_10585 [Acidimicrobiales bacterium]